MLHLPTIFLFTVLWNPLSLITLLDADLVIVIHAFSTFKLI